MLKIKFKIFCGHIFNKYFFNNIEMEKNREEDLKRMGGALEN